jgi:hypothetical protein
MELESIRSDLDDLTLKRKPGRFQALSVAMMADRGGVIIFSCVSVAPNLYCMVSRGDV